MACVGQLKKSWAHQGGASPMDELMFRISFSFPLNSEPTWTATVDKVAFGPEAKMN